MLPYGNKVTLPYGNPTYWLWCYCIIWQPNILALTLPHGNPTYWVWCCPTATNILDLRLFFTLSSHYGFVPHICLHLHKINICCFISHSSIFPNIFKKWNRNQNIFKCVIPVGFDICPKNLQQTLHSQRCWYTIVLDSSWKTYFSATFLKFSLTTVDK